MNLRSRRKGFTLLELLAVITILLVLIGILFVGLRKVQTSGREKQTRIAMQNLRSMTEAYRTAAGMFTPTAGNLDCPGNVTTQMNVDRNGSPTTITPVALTKCVMAKMLALNENNKIFSSVPEALKFQEYVVGPPPGATAWVTATPYTVLTMADYGTPSLTYVCYSDHLSETTKNIPTMARSPWLQYVVDTTIVPGSNVIWRNKPMMKDAWGNPIIFVPYGLGTTAGGSPKPVVVGGQNTTVISPDGKPFWVSAGEDGDFSTGDDNIYSFEN